MGADERADRAEVREMYYRKVVKARNKLTRQIQKASEGIVLFRYIQEVSDELEKIEQILGVRATETLRTHPLA